MDMVMVFNFQENIEDTKGVIKNRKSKKDMQYNAQKKMDKRTNSVLQNNTNKTNDLATRTPLKTRGESKIKYVFMEIRHFNHYMQSMLYTMHFSRIHICYVVNKYTNTTSIVLGIH